MMRTCGILLGFAALSGCASRSFTEADNKQAVEVDWGTAFTVSIPDSGRPKDKPAYSVTVLELVHDRRDEAGKRRVLEFNARAPGETDLKVPPDFLLHVRVASSQ